MQEISTYLDKYCKVFGPHGINLDLFIFARMFCFEYKNLASHKFFSGFLTVSSSPLTSHAKNDISVILECIFLSFTETKMYIILHRPVGGLRF